MIRKILLSLLIFIAATSVVYAAEQNSPAQKVNLAEVSAIRVGYGSGTVRIVIDINKKVEFVESYVENPSRMIVDLKNSSLSSSVPREIPLKSLAAKKIRVAQFDPTTVRIVIETMAETRPFHMNGGTKGHRLVIDVGNTEFKANSEVKTKTREDSRKKQEAELKAKQEAELKAKQEAELKAKQEAELKAKQEAELKAKQEAELKAKQEAELKAKQEQELREKIEREIREEKERELKAKQEAELKAKQEQELREKIERELREKIEREYKEKEEAELKAKQERELKAKQEREHKEKLEREIKAQREREKQLKEKEKQERRDKKNKDKDKKKDSKDEEEVTEVDAPFKDLDSDLDKITALSGKKIVIDPGHGGNDAGAIGPTGVMEKSVTLRVALELRKLLVAEGAEVILTRETDRTVSEKGAKASDIEELGARCDVANKNGAHIFISIHADSFTRPEARGTTGYYYSKGSGSGQKLADCIRRNLVEQLGTPSRGTQPCNFYVVKNTDMPATLIELGFISNKDEEKLLDSKEGVQKAAQGIFDGIEDYFG